MKSQHRHDSCAGRRHRRSLGDNMIELAAVRTMLNYQERVLDTDPNSYSRAFH